jgi:hypothetical protein
MAYFKDVGDFAKDNGGDEALAPFVNALQAGLDDLQKATIWFMENALAKPDNAGAGATDYMHLFGLVALAHMWTMIAKSARERIDADDPRADRLAESLMVGHAWIQRAMPETALRLARIAAGADALMAVPEAGL